MTQRTQENTLVMSTSLLQRIQLRNSQMEEMHRARYGGKRGTELPRPLRVGVPPSQHIHMSTSSEGLQMSLFQSF